MGACMEAPSYPLLSPVGGTNVLWQYTVFLPKIILLFTHYRGDPDEHPKKEFLWDRNFFVGKSVCFQFTSKYHHQKAESTSLLMVVLGCGHGGVWHVNIFPSATPLYRYLYREVLGGWWGGMYLCRWDARKNFELFEMVITR